MVKIREAVLKDMAVKSKATQMGSDVPTIAPDKKPKGPQYPYGLRLSLKSEELKKAGIKLQDVSIGDQVDIQALAKVIEIRDVQGNDYDEKSLELQITKLAVL